MTATKLTSASSACTGTQMVQHGETGHSTTSAHREGNNNVKDDSEAFNKKIDPPSSTEGAFYRSG